MENIVDVKCEVCYMKENNTALSWLYYNTMTISGGTFCYYHPWYVNEYANTWQFNSYFFGGRGHFSISYTVFFQGEHNSIPLNWLEINECITDGDVVQLWTQQGEPAYKITLAGWACGSPVLM